MKTLIITLLFFIPLFSYTQSGFVATGGDAENEGSFSYSIGQLDYQSFSDSEYKISEGLQQAFIEDVETNIEELSPSLEIEAYPNPTTDDIFIHLNEWVQEEIHISMVDMGGKQLLNENPTHLEDYRISTKHLSAGIYILNINIGEDYFKTFKIQKQ